MEMFNAFSDNLKLKISSSPEWEKLNKPQASTPAAANAAVAAAAFDDSDDIPF
jgi:hypothetical protein